MSTSIKGPPISYGFRSGSPGSRHWDARQHPEMHVSTPRYTSAPQDTRQHPEVHVSMQEDQWGVLLGTPRRGRRKAELDKGDKRLQCKVHPPSQPRPQPTLQGTLKPGWPFRDLQTSHYIWAARGKGCDPGRGSSLQLSQLLKRVDSWRLSAKDPHST